MRPATEYAVGTAYGAAIAGALWVLGADLRWYTAAAIICGVAVSFVTAHLSGPFALPARGRLK